ncbi:MAG: hypothetical protein LBM19_00940 [Holosporales bacterium]|jgi:hypothetical protein|nr:hypothetical protein [Holosporales bacterium]
MVNNFTFGEKSMRNLRKSVLALTTLSVLSGLIAAEAGATQRILSMPGAERARLSSSAAIQLPGQPPVAPVVQGGNAAIQSPATGTGSKKRRRSPKVPPVAPVQQAAAPAAPVQQAAASVVSVRSDQLAILQGLATESQSLRKGYEAWKADSEKKDGEIQRLTQELITKDAQITKMNEETQTAVAEIAQLKQRLATKESEIAQIIAAKDNDLATLHSQLQTAQQVQVVDPLAGLGMIPAAAGDESGSYYSEDNVAGS